MTTSTIVDQDSWDILRSRLGLSNSDVPAATALREGGVYVLLFRLRQQPGFLFHWGIYLHITTSVLHDDDGTVDYVLYGSKYNITDLTGVWRPDHRMTNGVLKSTALVVLARIGQVPSTSYRTFDTVIRRQDNTLNNARGMTCRIWTMQAIKDLCDAGLLTRAPGVSYEYVESELKSEGIRAFTREQPAVVGLWSFGTKSDGR